MNSSSSFTHPPAPSIQYIQIDINTVEYINFWCTFLNTSINMHYDIPKIYKWTFLSYFGQFTCTDSEGFICVNCSGENNKHCSLTFNLTLRDTK